MENQEIENFKKSLLFFCSLSIENGSVHWKFLFSIIKQHETSVRYRGHMEAICNLLTDYLLQYDCEDTTVALKIIVTYNRWCKWRRYKLQHLDKYTTQFILQPLFPHVVQKYKYVLPIRLHNVEVHETARLTGDVKLLEILTRYEELIPPGRRLVTIAIPNEIQDFETKFLNFCSTCTERKDLESISWNSILSFVKDHENIICHSKVVANVCNLLTDYLLRYECSDSVVVVKIVESYKRWCNWKLYFIQNTIKETIEHILQPLFPQGEKKYKSTPPVILINLEVYDTVRRAKDTKFYKVLSKYRNLIPPGPSQRMIVINNSGLVD